ncbi:MAG TPA: hypothetical protein VFW66_05810 [Gemmatimonadales bacterium]|nr:hypothetical protein [Gemmatimonadales bacterium]
MFRQRHVRRLLVAGGVIAAAACSDSGTPVGPNAQPDQPSLGRAAQGPAQGAADDPIELGRTVPGFGGFFVDAQGTPTVYLKDSGKRGAAELALAPWFRARGRAAQEMRVLHADYDWAELAGWQSKLTPEALAVSGAVFVDADEAANRVRIGVEHSAAAGQMRSLVARLGIPAGAVVVEQTEPIVQLATLQGRVRPIAAGLQINFPGFLCSIGFNASLGGKAGFVTASHCTTTQGGVESTPYWQPLQSVDGTQIATETADPSYTTGGACPAGRRCRRSDASFAQYASGIQNTLGSIEKTKSPRKRDLTITGAFTITSDASSSNFTIGEVINKVGRTTGWSQGQVVATCVNVNVSGSDITQLCQTEVSAGVGAGDSGSDVFTITGGSNVRLDGVLWGGSSNGRTFVFSPLANVEQELGALTTH